LSTSKLSEYREGREGEREKDKRRKGEEREFRFTV